MKSKKRFLVSFILLSLIINLCGCGENETSNQSSLVETVTEESTEVYMPFESANETVQLKINTDSPLNLTHKDALSIDLSQSELKSMNLPENGIVSSYNCIGDKLLLEIMYDGNASFEKIAVYDPSSDAYTKIVDVPFSAAYGEHSVVLQDKYCAFITSCEENDKLTGNVILYNADTNELQTIDSFSEQNIVNSITAVDESHVAYTYYDAETSEWIVKYCDINNSSSKEIFRHTNLNNNNTSSPMTIASDGENIALVVQYVENEVYHTCLLWIDPDGNWFNTEEIDLYSIYGNEYELTSLTIGEDYYFFDAILEDENVSAILYRSNNSFVPVETGPFRRNKMLSENVSDVSKVVYSQYYTGAKNMMYLIDMNLKENEMISYEYSTEFSDESGEYSFVNEQGDLFLIYSESGEYRVIEDYSLTEKRAYDYTLYSAPDNQSDLYPYSTITE